MKAIVIGSGMAGLTAAAYLVHTGYRVKGRGPSGGTRWQTSC